MGTRSVGFQCVTADVPVLAVCGCMMYTNSTDIGHFYVVSPAVEATCTYIHTLPTKI